MLITSAILMLVVVLVIDNAPIDTTLSQIMQEQQNLSDLGARNFILINIPPWDRSAMGIHLSDPVHFNYR